MLPTCCMENFIYNFSSCIIINWLYMLYTVIKYGIPYIHVAICGRDWGDHDHSKFESDSKKAETRVGILYYQWYKSGGHIYFAFELFFQIVTLRFITRMATSESYANLKKRIENLTECAICTETMKEA